MSTKSVEGNGLRQNPLEEGKNKLTKKSSLFWTIAWWVALASLAWITTVMALPSTAGAKVHQAWKCQLKDPDWQAPFEVNKYMALGDSVLSIPSATYDGYIKWNNPKWTCDPKDTITHAWKTFIGYNSGNGPEYVPEDAAFPEETIKQEPRKPIKNRVAKKNNREAVVKRTTPRIDWKFLDFSGGVLDISFDRLIKQAKIQWTTLNKKDLSSYDFTVTTDWKNWIIELPNDRGYVVMQKNQHWIQSNWEINWVDSIIVIANKKVSSWWHSKAFKIKIPLREKSPAEIKLQQQQIDIDNGSLFVLNPWPVNQAFHTLQTWETPSITKKTRDALKTLWLSPRSKSWVLSLKWNVINNTTEDISLDFSFWVTSKDGKTKTTIKKKLIIKWQPKIVKVPNTPKNVENKSKDWVGEVFFIQEKPLILNTWSISAVFFKWKPWVSIHSSYSEYIEKNPDLNLIYNKKSGTLLLIWKVDNAWTKDIIFPIKYKVITAWVAKPTFHRKDVIIKATANSSTTPAVVPIAAISSNTTWWTDKADPAVVAWWTDKADPAVVAWWTDKADPAVVAWWTDTVSDLITAREQALTWDDKTPTVTVWWANKNNSNTPLVSYPGDFTENSAAETIESEWYNWSNIGDMFSLEWLQNENLQTWVNLDYASEEWVSIWVEASYSFTDDDWNENIVLKLWADIWETVKRQLLAAWFQFKYSEDGSGKIIATLTLIHSSADLEKGGFDLSLEKMAMLWKITVYNDSSLIKAFWAEASSIDTSWSKLTWDTVQRTTIWSMVQEIESKIENRKETAANVFATLWVLDNSVHLTTKAWYKQTKYDWPTADTKGATWGLGFQYYDNEGRFTWWAWFTTGWWDDSIAPNANVAVNIPTENGSSRLSLTGDFADEASTGFSWKYRADGDSQKSKLLAPSAKNASVSGELDKDAARFKRRVAWFSSGDIYTTTTLVDDTDITDPNAQTWNTNYSWWTFDNAIAWAEKQTSITITDLDWIESVEISSQWETITNATITQVWDTNQYLISYTQTEAWNSTITIDTTDSKWNVTSATYDTTAIAADTEVEHGTPVITENWNETVTISPGETYEYTVDAMNVGWIGNTLTVTGTFLWAPINSNLTNWMTLDGNTFSWTPTNSDVWNSASVVLTVNNWYNTETVELQVNVDATPVHSLTVTPSLQLNDDGSISVDYSWETNISGLSGRKIYVDTPGFGTIPSGNTLTNIATLWEEHNGVYTVYVWYIDAVTWQEVVSPSTTFTLENWVITIN